MNCAEQFRVMAFAQLTWRESLRDIAVTLSANASKLYPTCSSPLSKRSFNSIPDGHPNSPTCGHLKFPHPVMGLGWVKSYRLTT